MKDVMAQSEISTENAESIAEPESNDNKNYVFKLVLLGSSGVGKSSLALRYVKEDFWDLPSTVGCAFFTQLVCLSHATIRYEIWDTAGQEKYQSVCHLYYRGANAAFLVYDVTSKETFLRAQLWLRELEREFSAGDIIIALIGNKTDLSAEREVTTEEGQTFAENKSILFMETSAKNDENVTEAFLVMANKLLKHEEHKQVQSMWNPRLYIDLDADSMAQKQHQCCNS